MYFSCQISCFYKNYLKKQLGDSSDSHLFKYIDINEFYLRCDANFYWYMMNSVHAKVLRFGLYRFMSHITITSWWYNDYIGIYYTSSSLHWGPFGRKCHELFVILYTTDQNYFNQYTIRCIIWTFVIQILKQSLKS